jgi:alkaline phosphatase D
MILSNTSRIIGVWDDHDYGENNGNINNRVKHQMRDIFLDFIEEP